MLFAFALMTSLFGSVGTGYAYRVSAPVAPRTVAAPGITDTMPITRHELDPEVSLEVIQAWEGNSDTLTWPKGWSGPTIGCGIDLGHIGKKVITSVFEDLVHQDTLKMLLHASGLSGERAHAFAVKHRGFKLSQQQVRTANVRVAKVMWEASCNRFPGLSEAPGTVKTAVLSVMMNRGPNNQGLEHLGTLIAHKHWVGVAHALETMPVPKGMAGIGKRRRAEAQLIRQTSFELDPD